MQKSPVGPTTRLARTTIHWKSEEPSADNHISLCHARQKCFGRLLCSVRMLLVCDGVWPTMPACIQKAPQNGKRLKGENATIASQERGPSVGRAFNLE